MDELANIHFSKLDELRGLYIQVKECILLAENFDPDHSVYLSPVNELRNALDHIMRSFETDSVTDSHLAYSGLNLHYVKHEVVNHLENEFKRGTYHTNSIENAWSNLKRTIKGTHIHVSKVHLQKYVDEVAFRLMNKDRQDEMFDIILSHVVF